MSTTGPLHYPPVTGEGTADQLFKRIVRDFMARDYVDGRVSGAERRVFRATGYEYAEEAQPTAPGLDSASPTDRAHNSRGQYE